MHKLLLIFLIIASSFLNAQELIAEVKVDYSQVRGSSTTAYTALEKSLKDFINTTKWTDSRYKIHEKIEANFTIIINEKIGSNRYKASLLVQSRRPVFSSIYYTPILNVNDRDFEFEYTEYEQLIFNSRQFSNKNLTDVIGYYIYLILGYDADTFSRMGGTSYFEISQTVASNAQSSDFNGWNQIQGPRNRSSLISEIINSKNNLLRNIYYTYHRTGLDMMSQNELNSKNTIANSLLTLEKYQQTNNYAQNYPLDLFFQAKKGEISQIYSGGLPTTASLSKLKSLLNTISPTNSDEWNKIEK